MWSRTYSFTLAFILLCSAPLLGQDLGKLQSRVSKLWELRQQANKLDALPLVSAETRQTYLQLVETPITSFKVSGLEFTSDPNRVEVLVTVHAMIIRVGELDRTVRESWVWKDGEWFLQAMAAPKLFESTGNKGTGSSVTVPPEFHIANAVIDIGRHSQGDVIEGKIAFQAPRNEIFVIRPLQSTPGLAVGAPTWNSPTEGYLPYRWDTTFVWQNVSKTITLEAKATSEATAHVDLQVRAQIDGKVAFKQVPATIDPGKSGQVELQIQNLSSTKPLKLLSVLSRNRIYVVDDDIPEIIAPGKSGRLLIKYVGQIEPEGAAVAIEFSEHLGNSPNVIIPLNMKLPEEAKPAPPTREELDRIIKAAPKPKP